MSWAKQTSREAKSARHVAPAHTNKTLLESLSPHSLIHKHYVLLPTAACRQCLLSSYFYYRMATGVVVKDRSYFLSYFFIRQQMECWPKEQIVGTDIPYFHLVHSSLSVIIPYNNKNIWHYLIIFIVNSTATKRRLTRTHDR